MLNDLKPIAIFAELIKQGSFRAAARSLHLSPSVVSYHLSQLEKRVGAALIYRSTRKLSLTHDGELLYESAKRMLAAAEKGLNRLSDETREAFGRLKLSLPAALNQAPILVEIAEFAKTHPKVEFEFYFSDLRVDLIAQGFDLAIRMGKMPDSGLKSKRVSVLDRTLVCTPAYFASKKKPRQLKDLATWDWIRMQMMPTKRVFRSKANKKMLLDVDSRTLVDSADAMTCLCLAGLGLATPPHFMVEQHLVSGALVEVLPQWCVEPMPIYAVWPANCSKDSLTLRLLTHLSKLPEHI